MKMEQKEEQGAEESDVQKDGKRAKTSHTIKYDKWQQDFLNTKGDKMLSCGRQVGKSVICAKDAGDWAMNNPNSTILMIAPVERQSFALFDKTLSYIGNTNKKMLKRGKDRPTKTHLTLTNKTVIWCLPVGMAGAGIRFLTVHRLYEDESSRIPDAVQSAVEPMLLTTGGDTIRLSTPFGAEGTFADTWFNKDDAYGSFTRFSVDSETVVSERLICDTWTEKQRTKALEKIAQAKSRMTELEFAQEYMGKFLTNLRQVYPDNLIRQCMVLDKLENIDITRTHALGIDVARMGDDDSTFEIFDIEDPDNIEQRDNQITKKTLAPDTFQHIINLNRMYDGFKSIFIDAYGNSIFDWLIRNDDTKRNTVAIGHLDRPLDSEEKQKSKLIKEDLYNNLLILMQSGKIKFLKDESIFESLKSVQFEMNDGKIKYTGTYKHIADGMIRGAYGVNTRGLNIYIY